MALLPFANSSSGGGGSGTVTSVSVVTANGVSGSVSNPTTTPAITLTLGAITPTTVNGLTITGSTGTLTIANGETLTLTKGLTVTTNAGTLAFSAASKTLTIADNASISGTNTGDQTITLTGDVTGTGTSSFATAVKSSVALSGSPTTTTQTPADNSTKIATTAYVDNAVLGQNFKEAVGVATTANLVGVYLNGASGVGATFTYTATGVDTIDGVALTLGMRVLVKNQSTAFQNGLYTVTTAGALGIAGILTRATDGDQTTDWKTGDSTFVTAGTTQATTTWAYTGIDSPTMGTTSLTFAQTAGQGSFTAGNGIAITGNSIAIDTAITVDTTTAQTLTNKTLTSPKINEAVALTTTATKLNYLTSATGTTGTASTNIVFSTSPSLTTPTIGVATATSVNKVAITAPATSATLTIPDGVTLTGPASSGTAMTLGNDETVTGIKTFGSSGAVGKLKIAGTTSGSTILDATAVASGTLTLPAATDTLVGKATTDTLTNKTIDASQLVAATVTAAKMQYGMIRNRQGGTTGDNSWYTKGSSNTDTSAKAVFMQVGAAALGTEGTTVTITFPTAYSQVPVVFCQISTAVSANVFVEVRTISTTQFTCVAILGNGSAETFTWLSIGQ